MAGLAALAGLFVGCGPIAAYAATVDGERVSQSALNDELEAIRNNTAYGSAVEQQLAQGGEKLRGSGKGTFDASFVARVLTRQIFLEIVHQGLKAKHVKVPQRALDEARKQQEDTFKRQFASQGGIKVWNKFPKSYRDTLVRRAAEVQALQDALSKGKVDDKAISDYYEAHKADFAQTCVRHILAAFPGDRRADPTPPPADVDAAARAKAQSWKDRVAKGEDFAAIAKAESDDKGSGAEGGDLGCQGGFVKEFDDAMNALAVGQVSDPVKSQFGYHIIQVTERKQRTLEEATDEIRQQLEGGQQDVVQNFLEDRIKKASIKVNPRYGRFDKGDPARGTQPQVVPPKGPSTTTTTAAGRTEESVPVQNP